MTTELKIWLSPDGVELSGETHDLIKAAHNLPDNPMAAGYACVCAGFCATSPYLAVQAIELTEAQLNWIANHRAGREMILE